MTRIDWPQTCCRMAIARCDITPLVGIYHRMWGAATHDRATGVHRPLLATVLWLEPAGGDASQAMVVVNLDHCLLDDADIEQIRRAVAEPAEIRGEQVLVALTHTHGAGLMSRSRATQPGGELIGPYLDELSSKLQRLAMEARAALTPATILYGSGRSTLATNRDFYDADRGQFVCGFNPSGPADDTVLVAKVLDAEAHVMATLVNYACHPTTLAWQNTLISPDFVGALRETIESRFPAPCVFLQGASADLGPREGFVGGVAVADRNGRQLAFAALEALESLPPPQTRFEYSGAVTSGATLGIWQHQPLSAVEVTAASHWKVAHWHEPLAYRHELPSLSQSQEELKHWQHQEEIASRQGQALQARDCRARAEQITRQIWRLQALPPDRFPLPVTLARLGNALWLFTAGEHYQALQTSLRDRFPSTPLIVSTNTNGWQPGYIPPAEIYGRGIYQEQIAVVAPDAAEQVLQAIVAQMESLFEAPFHAKPVAEI